MARVISGDGYWMVTPPDGYKGKTYIEGRYVFEHRLLMQQKIGRLLKREEVVDHINGDRLDNRIENLQILSPIEHNKKHYVYKGDNIWCKLCNKGFRKSPYWLKNKKTFFCCREHYRKYLQKNGNLNSQIAQKVKFNCSYCSKQVVIWKREFKARIKKNKYHIAFCSKSCGGKYNRDKK